MCVCVCACVKMDPNLDGSFCLCLVGRVYVCATTRRSTDERDCDPPRNCSPSIRIKIGAVDDGRRPWTAASVKSRKQRESIFHNTQPTSIQTFERTRSHQFYGHYRFSVAITIIHCLYSAFGLRNSFSVGFQLKSDDKSQHQRGLVLDVYLINRAL